MEQISTDFLSVWNAQKGMHAIKVLLNYAGGAYIYIRREYASRIRIIHRSWKTANKQEAEEFEEAIASGLRSKFGVL